MNELDASFARWVSNGMLWSAVAARESAIEVQGLPHRANAG